MHRNKVFQLFYGLTLVVFVVSGITLFLRTAALHRGEEFYQRLNEQAEVFYQQRNEQAEIFYQQRNEQAEETSSAYTFTASSLPAAAEDYPSIVTWLRIPDTTIDYPVVLGEDNQFYLNHLPDGTKNILGSLFLDYRTNPDSPHLIIYGHNGSGGKMFGLLKQYESPDYFAEHSTLTLSTADNVYNCPIFSVRRVTADSEAYTLEFENSDQLTTYLEQAAAESLYPIKVQRNNATRIVTLSTCTAHRNERLIVQALLQE